MANPLMLTDHLNRQTAVVLIGRTKVSALSELVVLSGWSRSNAVTALYDCEPVAYTQVSSQGVNRVDRWSAFQW